MPEVPPPDARRVVDRRTALTLEVCAVLGASLVPAAFAWLDPRVRGHASHAYTLTSIYWMLTSLGATGLLLFVMWNSGDPWSSFGISRPKWLDAPLSVLVIAVELVVVSLLWLPFGYHGWLSTEVHLIGPVSATASPISIGLMVVTTLLSALREELLVRGYLLARFTELFRSPIWAVVVSSGLFGMAHSYEGPRGVLVTTVMGLLLATSMVLTKRLWPLVIAHAAYNILLYLSV